jgi:hypothetical protein
LNFTAAVRPPPGRGWSDSSPSWARAIDATMESPRPAPPPVPVRAEPRRSKGRCSRVTCSGVMCRPLLATVTAQWPSWVTVRRLMKPAGML